MRRISFGVFLIAMSTLALELLLARVFDAILITNISYFIVTSAVFAFGLAGIYVSLNPLPAAQDVRSLAVRLALVLAVVAALLVPIINALPFDPLQAFKAPLRQSFYLLGIYLTMIVPFFVSGYLLIAVFSTYSKKIQVLYFWDLAGAGIGAVIILPFIPMIGPGGLTLCVAATALVAASLFSHRRKATVACLAGAAVLVVVPFTLMPRYIDFDNHMEKRSVVADKKAGRLEVTKWDPVSKIEVLDDPLEAAPAAKPNPWRATGGDRKHIAYDGGNQSSFFYKFDGDLEKLRKAIDNDRMVARQQFWQISVPAADYLKRDTGHRVLVIGSAGGHDTKAALMYGARQVDAIELVSAVVDLGKNQYANYIGNIFSRPGVHAQAGEGRSFLRATGQRYDVIQIHSNYTSSSIAQGTGALAPSYLQTVEAYQEYFEHLTDDGVLQVNHHSYPRMITAAAVAWKRMGRGDFQKHVAVFETPIEKHSPTLLIKMSPWTEHEMADLKAYLSPQNLPELYSYKLVENPLHPEESFLSSAFYSGDLPKSISDRMPVRVTPITDDHPYFDLLRKRIGKLVVDPTNFVNEGMISIPNMQLKGGFVPMDLVHLIGISILSIVFMCLFVFVPLRFSAVGREEGAKAIPLLVYFSCLGAGFIIFELVFIQKLMQLIGSPLYTYSTVLFALLLSSGLGSLASGRVAPAGANRWRIPFMAIVALCLVFTLVESSVFRFGLGFALPGRMLTAALLISPIGFFLGMPFPLGILAIEGGPKGSVAWAWGMNGVFTVIGGVLSVFLGLAFGFTVTLLIAMGFYVLATIAYPKLDVVQRLGM